MTALSKTDKTNPHYVKWFYEPNYLEEIHDHRFHDCNLPPRPKPGDGSFPDSVRWYGNHDRPCFWWPSLHFQRSRWARCGCWMCHGSWWEDRNRNDRRKAKRYCRDGWRDEY